MSDLHSAMRLQQLCRWSGTAAQCDIIPEGLRLPLPYSTRGLVISEDGPVEDLEARLFCLTFGVFYWILYIVYIVSVLFYVTSLTAQRSPTAAEIVLHGWFERG